MRDLIVLVIHLIMMVFRLARPGGLRAVVAESVLIKHQLLILNRSHRRAPNLNVSDRLIAGFCSLSIKPNRLQRVAIALKPSTVLHFHRVLVQRKYRLLFSPKRRASRDQKSNAGFDSRRCRDETAQCDLGLPAYRRANQPRLRDFYK